SYADTRVPLPADRTGPLGPHGCTSNAAQQVRNTSTRPTPAAANTISTSVVASRMRWSRWCASSWPPRVTVTRRVKDQRPQPKAACTRLGAGRTARGEGALRDGARPDGGDQDGRGRRATLCPYPPPGETWFGES